MKFQNLKIPIEMFVTKIWASLNFNSDTQETKEIYSMLNNDNNMKGVGNWYDQGMKYPIARVRYKYLAFQVNWNEIAFVQITFALRKQAHHSIE